ncbi:MAG: hypothetical protein JNM07_14640, partial [Phycisphaerae bacterium]|nr:hypothetical protein [Phycisphaerae bacterium]
RPHRAPAAAPQRGISIMVSLVLLVVVTLIALGSMRGVVMQARMSGASHDRSLSFQAAEAALREAVARSGLRQVQVMAPGAEQGAQGTPPVALATRLAVEQLESVADFDPSDRVPVPDLGLATRFERPVLHARLRLKHGQPLHVLVAHLKSKRPKFLQD